MSSRLFDRFWHRRLGRPYYLARPIDQGQGPPVILLHGIGRTGQTWQRVVDGLSPLPCRLVAFDLLGFGASPKPDWPEYNIDDHARAVIATLEKLPPLGPAVLVGHSMGCLVAVRVARLRPDLVKHLVLYEMPLYEGLPEKRRYRLRLNLYSRFYRHIIRYQPTFDAQTARLTERLAQRIAGFEVTPETWQPFVKSLEHTIMQQTAPDDIKHLQAPMDVIYGTLDILVIRGKPNQIFGDDAGNITAHTIRERHVISERASRFLVERVTAALSGPDVKK
ncbi:MAG TPA: alpha/beta hydrolase [Candidatus Saccharimonadales bacterium]